MGRAVVPVSGQGRRHRPACQDLPGAERRQEGGGRSGQVSGCGMAGAGSPAPVAAQRIWRGGLARSAFLFVPKRLLYLCHADASEQINT
ncbi:protein of unknown function [Magnetospirillum sp. XM-1]|nr:protein of unknown function [Magnetospirillum sp. XM-1]